MPDFMENSDTHAVIKEKLRRNFDGKIVRKDLTKKSKRVQMSRYMSWNSCWDSTVALMIRMLSKKA